MTRRSFDFRRAALGQAVIPLSLFALVALVGGLVYHTRTLEASHRATAENALRDYASLAAWQYNLQAESYLQNTAQITLHNVHAAMHPSDRPLPPPDTIVRFGDSLACGIGRVARFAFYVDLDTREARFAGAIPDAATQRAVVERFVAFVSDVPKSRHPMRMLIDTLAGVPRVVAYGVALGADSLPRGIYGVEADISAIVPELNEIPTKGKALLPPSLLRGRPADSVLMVQVSRADGAPLTSIGSASDDRLAAGLAMHPHSGGLRTRVIVRPEAAPLLLIGGVPGSRPDMLLLLLAGSVLLAGVALLQIRRGRELARLRTRFVANVSHELRTPLAQISMFSETLLLGRERTAEEGRQYLSIIFREARRLSHLVESVLRFSRSEAMPELRMGPLETRDVTLDIRDAVRAFTPLAAAAGAELATRLEDEAFANVEPGALRQMVINLLDNAVKFGPPSEGQRIEVSVERAGREIIIAVTDEGPGIPASERSKVFEPFAQGSASNTKRATGAGIGLAVVADLVAAHRGRVWIEDGPGGVGARVAFALPAVDAITASPVEALSVDVEDTEILSAR